MKYLLLSIFCLLSVFGYAQSTLPLRADTVLIEKSGGSGELKIKNSTRDSLGVLVNIGGGKTRFMRAKALNDSTLVIGLDTIRISGGTATNLVARNGLTKSNDTLYLGGDLTKWTWIKTYSNRSETPAAPLENALVLGNEIIPDSSNYWWLSANDGTTNIYDKSNIYLSRTYKAVDTVYKNYGGNISATTFTNYDQIQPRYKNIATPIILPYGNMSANHVVHTPDTAYMQTSPYGHSANIGADFRIGANRPYRVTIFSQSNISGPYPMTVYRGGIDLAHRSSAVKRESYGNGYVSYVSDFRNHQATVNAGSTELGSYVSKIGGFYAFGNLAPFTASPSKAKTLAVSTADTVYGFWAAPQYTDLNETKNGYGYIAQGTQDDNHFAGRFRLGGSLPLHATVMRRFHNTGTSEFNDSVYISNILKLGTGTATPAVGSGFNLYMDSGLQVGYSYGNRVYASIAQYQTGITAANYSTKRTKGLIVEMDWEYSDPAVDITDKFQRAVLGYANVIADDFLNVSSTNGGVGGSEFGLLYRKRTGFTDTTVFQGGATPYLSPWALSGTLDMTGSAASSVTRLNWAKGYHTALNAKVSWNQWHRVSNAIWLRTGDVQSGGANSQVDTGYQIYMLPSDSRVLTKYGIYQAGAADSNSLAGPLRLLNLTSGTGTDSVVVVNNGVVKRVLQSSISGSTPALTTNQIGVGIASVLGGYSSFTYDGTTVKQENATAAHSITSTTALGTTSGGDVRMLVKATPDAADRRMGGVLFGTLDGGSTENLTAGMEAYSNAAHTPSSSEQTRLDFTVSAVSSRFLVMRLMHNGRVGIGGVTSPSGILNVAAGSTSVPQMVLNSGTFATTPVNGGFEYNGTSFRLTTGAGARRAVVSNDVAPSNGQIAIGNGTDYTIATPASSDGSVTITTGAGSLDFKVAGASAFPVASYTPTLTNTANITGSTTYTTYYQRIGNKVEVWGKLDLDPVAATTETEIGISLPVASSFANDMSLSGTGACGGNNSTAGIEADVSNSRAKLIMYPTVDGLFTVRFHFSYYYTAP